MIYKTYNRLADTSYVIEMSTFTFSEELLNYSTRDLLVGGCLCEDVDSHDLPHHTKERIRLHYYNTYPIGSVLWERYAVAGFTYLSDDPITGKMVIRHQQGHDDRKNVFK